MLTLLYAILCACRNCINYFHLWIFLYWVNCGMRKVKCGIYYAECRWLVQASNRVGLKIKIYEIHQNLRNPVSINRPIVAATCLNQRRQPLALSDPYWHGRRANEQQIGYIGHFEIKPKAISGQLCTLAELTPHPTSRRQTFPTIAASRSIVTEYCRAALQRSGSQRAAI